MLSEDDLLAPFAGGAKPRADFKLGLELEYFPVRLADGRMLPYEPGIRAVLTEMARRHGWTPAFEGERIVALSRDGSTVTLEPGGAVELSTHPTATVLETRDLACHFVGEITAVTESCGAALLAMGYHPTETPASVALVPKARYDFMYEYMPRVGGRGREMMKVTSSVQVAIDYESESDAMRKLAVATRLTPVFVALSANSPARQGSYAGRVSNRAWAWLDTDAARCGAPDFAFSTAPRFADYADWALDAPMYFVHRDGAQIAMNGLSFREFDAAGRTLENGARLEATRADWLAHLGTLFPWVRMRDFVEIRSFDMNPLPTALAFTALVAGLFYDDLALARAGELVAGLDRTRFDALLLAAIEHGLDGRAAGLELRELSAEIVAAARGGLARRGAGEVELLEPLEARVASWSAAEVRSAVEHALDALIAAHRVTPCELAATREATPPLGA